MKSTLKILLACLAAASAIVSTRASAQVTHTPGLVLYDDVDLQTQIAQYTIDENITVGTRYSLGNLRNRVSSLAIEEGYTVTLIDHDGRRQMSLLSGDVENLGQFSDRADAFIVERK